MHERCMPAGKKRNEVRVETIPLPSTCNRLDHMAIMFASTEAVYILRDTKKAEICDNLIVVYVDHADLC